MILTDAQGDHGPLRHGRINTETKHFIWITDSKSRRCLNYLNRNANAWPKKTVFVVMYILYMQIRDFGTISDRSDRLQRL